MRRVILMVFIFLGIFAFSAQTGLSNPGKSSNPEKKKTEAGLSNSDKSSDSEKKKQGYLPILDRWSGDYPAADLHRLMEREDPSNGGYIGNEAAFVSFWNVFRRSSPVPAIDFDKNMVVFVIGERNWRQMFVAKATLKEGTAEIVADGYKSGFFSEDRVPIALAVIPRAGVQFVRVGKNLIAVE
jgi:hypothetical protein